MMKEKKLIAFDLFDTCFAFRTPEANIAHKQLLSDLGMTHKRRELYNILLTSSKSIEDILLQNFSEADVCMSLATYHENIAHEIQSAQFFPETLAVLSALKQRGYSLAAVSNISQSYIQVLQNLLPHTFDYEVLSCEVGLKKPDRKIFDCLKTISGYTSDEIVMVGDSLSSDIQGAKNSGIDPVHIDRSSQGIVYHENYISISTLKQLLEIL